MNRCPAALTHAVKKITMSTNTMTMIVVVIIWSSNFDSKDLEDLVEATEDTIKESEKD